MPQLPGPSQTTPNKPPELQLELPAQLDATYSNFVVIQHAPAEFIIDFARVLPNVPTARVGARVIMSPLHAKLLLRALHENIEKYEVQFGPIYVPQQGGDQLASSLFTGQKPPQR